MRAHGVTVRRTASERPVGDYPHTVGDNVGYGLIPRWQSALGILIVIISIICAVKMICVQNDTMPT